VLWFEDFEHIATTPYGTTGATVGFTGGSIVADAFSTPTLYGLDGGNTSHFGVYGTASTDGEKESLFGSYFTGGSGNFLSAEKTGFDSATSNRFITFSTVGSSVSSSYGNFSLSADFATSGGNVIRDSDGFAVFYRSGLSGNWSLALLTNYDKRSKSLFAYSADQLSGLSSYSNPISWAFSSDFVGEDKKTAGFISATGGTQAATLGTTFQTLSVEIPSAEEVQIRVVLASGGNNAVFALDDLSLTVAAAIPEPATCAMVLGAFAGIVVLVRRKRRLL